MRVINSKTKLLYLLIIVMVAALASSASAIFDNAYKDGVTNYSESWGDGQLTGAIAPNGAGCPMGYPGRCSKVGCDTHLRCIKLIFC